MSVNRNNQMKFNLSLILQTLCFGLGAWTLHEVVELDKSVSAAAQQFADHERRISKLEDVLGVVHKNKQLSGSVMIDGQYQK